MNRPDVDRVRAILQRFVQAADAYDANKQHELVPADVLDDFDRAGAGCDALGADALDALDAIAREGVRLSGTAARRASAIREATARARFADGRAVDPVSAYADAFARGEIMTMQALAREPLPVIVSVLDGSLGAIDAATPPWSHRNALATPLFVALDALAARDDERAYGHREAPAIGSALLARLIEAPGWAGLATLAGAVCMKGQPASLAARFASLPVARRREVASRVAGFEPRGEPSRGRGSLRLLEDPDPLVRRTAMRALQGADAPDDAELPRRLLASDPDPIVRGLAIEAIVDLALRPGAPKEAIVAELAAHRDADATAEDTLVRQLARLRTAPFLRDPVARHVDARARLEQALDVLTLAHDPSAQILALADLDRAMGDMTTSACFEAADATRFVALLSRPDAERLSRALAWLVRVRLVRELMLRELETSRDEDAPPTALRVIETLAWGDAELALTALEPEPRASVRRRGLEIVAQTADHRHRAALVALRDAECDASVRAAVVRAIDAIDARSSM